MEIVRVASSARDVSGVLTEVCVQVAKLCDAERGTVFLYKEETGEVIPAMSQLASAEPQAANWKRFKKHGRRPQQEMRLIRLLAQSGEPLTIADARDSELIKASWVESFGSKSVLGVPLLAEGRVIGALILDTIESVRPFTAPQIELAIAAAEQLAIVLHRALHLEETELRLRRTEARLEIARTLSSALELKMVLKAVAQQRSSK